MSGARAVKAPMGERALVRFLTAYLEAPHGADCSVSIASAPGDGSRAVVLQLDEVACAVPLGSGAYLLRMIERCADAPMLDAGERKGFLQLADVVRTALVAAGALDMTTRH